MSRGVITQVRDIVPIRPLTRAEAYRVAELQASRFLEASGITDAPVRESAITELPRIRVQRYSPLPVSGATQWSNGTWMVLLNGGEVPARQRFSLAHEFKHILDHRFIDVLYQRIPEPDRAAFTESICDYFAACLLMPRAWMKRAWGDGIQRPSELAARFGVSQLAAQVRLSQLGLGERPARCGRLDPRWTLPWNRSTDTTTGYHRLTSPVPI